MRAVRTTLGAVLVLAAVGCSSGPPTQASGNMPSAGQQQTVHPPGTGQSQGSASTPQTTPTSPGNLTVAGIVARDLTTPWGVDFLPNGHALVTGRDTRKVLRITPQGRVSQVGTVSAARPSGEGGLLGIAVSPRFRTDRAVFVYFTAGSENRIARYTLGADGRLATGRVILDGIPAGSLHNGGRLEFGPDDMLYAGTGDAGVTSRAQDPRSLGGKILRMTRSGSAPAGNPFPGSVVYSLGHRNVQGLAFDQQGRLWASEFGQNAWDELNLIRPAGNYGWPDVEGPESDPRFVNPKEVWTPDVASPSGIAHLGGAAYMAGLRGSRLWQIPTAGTLTGDPKAFFTGRYGRLRTVTVAPDGSLWVVTSNTDGRGFPAAHDDRILRVVVQ